MRWVGVRVATAREICSTEAAPEGGAAEPGRQKEMVDSVMKTRKRRTVFKRSGFFLSVGNFQRLPFEHHIVQIFESKSSCIKVAE